MWYSKVLFSAHVCEIFFQSAETVLLENGFVVVIFVADLNGARSYPSHVNDVTILDVLQTQSQSQGKEICEDKNIE